MKKAILSAVSAAVLTFAGNVPAMADMNSSWTDNGGKAAIMAFVESVTTEGSTTYLPPEQRIAVFDNDGTLWTEKPAYSEVIFALGQVQAMASDIPEWNTEEPFSIIVEKGLGALKDIGLQGAIAAVEGVYSKLNDEDLNARIQAFLADPHLSVDRAYAQATFAPMTDLIGYLHANDFEVFIVTGGSNNFVRNLASEAYGIDPHNVIGSVLDAEIIEVDGVLTVQRLPKFHFNDGMSKVLNIVRQIGVRPTIVVGNADGDLPMIRYGLQGDGPRLAVLINHDDDEREVAYDRGAGNAIAAAALDGDNFLLISMKDDFAIVWE